jgi:hypothetical protein
MIDDGVVAIRVPFAADIGRFVNGEDVSNQDVVVWYAAHFTHDVGRKRSMAITSVPPSVPSTGEGAASRPEAANTHERR